MERPSRILPLALLAEVAKPMKHHCSLFDETEGSWMWQRRGNWKVWLAYGLMAVALPIIFVCAWYGG